MTAEQVAEAIGGYEQAGFTELAINFAGRAGPGDGAVEWFAAEVMPLVSL